MTTFKCSIPGNNIKVLARAVHSLAKVGEELYLESNKDGILWRTVNSSRSGYGSFLFQPNFFSFYDLKSADQTSVNCKLCMKSILKVFKSLSIIERSVETCELSFSEEQEQLKIQLCCRHEIVKVYLLNISDYESLQISLPDKECENSISVQSKLLSNAFLNFHSSVQEVTFNLSAEQISISNYVDDEPDPSKETRTELTLETGEFETYCINLPNEITFCVKELKALLSFSDNYNLILELHFIGSGLPIVISSQSEQNYKVNYILATLCKGNTPIAPVIPVNESLTDKIALESEQISPKDVELTVPGTPPPKKKMCFLFQRCFEPTFHASMVSGYSQVLAPDSDDDT